MSNLEFQELEELAGTCRNWSCACLHTGVLVAGIASAGIRRVPWRHGLASCLPHRGTFWWLSMQPYQVDQDGDQIHEGQGSPQPLCHGMACSSVASTREPD